MKAYKVFKHDWTCKGMQYKVGQTYEWPGELKLCPTEQDVKEGRGGFHACINLLDCFTCYPPVQWNKFAEVELLGDILCGNGDKQVTNKIRIVKELSFSDALNLLEDGSSCGVNGVINVHGASGVNGAINVRGACYVYGAINVHGACYVHGASGVNGACYVHGVSDVRGVSYAYGASYVYGASEARGACNVHGACNVYGTHNVRGARNVHGAHDVCGVCDVRGACDVYGAINCNGIESCLFCVGISGKSFHIFNKPVTESRFIDVKSSLLSNLCAWKPNYTNALALKGGKEWEETPIPEIKSVSKADAWAGMPVRAIEYLSSLPEFDADIFYQITGQEVQ